MALPLCFVVVVAVTLFPVRLEAQQSYVNNKQLKCDESPNTTLGFVCNAAPSCTSYFTFRSTPLYNSPATIAYLLSADASEIASANSISDVAPLPDDTLVIVPVNCSCSGELYQHNASYTLKNPGETYFSVANNTYQSLSTCQALIAQNPYDLRRLLPGMKLTVPLRCACPTPAQIAAGFTYLLTYLVRQGNDFNSIAAQFAGAGADVQAIHDANMLPAAAIIFFFTPLLVPLKIPPTKANINTTATNINPPAPPTTTTSPAATHKWVFIGLGVGAAFLVVLSSIAVVWLFRRRRRRLESTPPAAEETTAPPSLPVSILSERIRSAMETLSVYTMEELEKATNWFAESNRVNGSSSVYRGLFKGDEAVVKVVKGEVWASREMEALRQMNHSRIVRLSGFCLHEGTTYLVYEYAHNGSLAHCLRNPPSNKNKSGQVLVLDWKQRLQIAYDVADALNYLHNFTSPPYIHKNLTANAILLDANMRAKLGSFGLARTLLDDDDNVTTRHVVGAQGYMSPEYIEMGLLTPKLDVFAFGVVMLELLSGKDPVDNDLSRIIGGVLNGDNVREKLRQFMDPALREDYPLELAYSMAQLANICVARNPDARPPVSELLLTLSSLRSSSLDWDPSIDTSITFSE